MQHFGVQLCVQMINRFFFFLESVDPQASAVLIGQPLAVIIIKLCPVCPTNIILTLKAQHVPSYLKNVTLNTSSFVIELKKRNNKNTKILRMFKNMFAFDMTS